MMTRRTALTAAALMPAFPALSGEAPSAPLIPTYREWYAKHNEWQITITLPPHYDESPAALRLEAEEWALRTTIAKADPLSFGDLYCKLAVFLEFVAHEDDDLKLSNWRDELDHHCFATMIKWVKTMAEAEGFDLPPLPCHYSGPDRLPAWHDREFHLAT